MYKKIMFLIITLSIIINVGNSTVVMASENIVAEIVDFPQRKILNIARNAVQD